MISPYSGSADRNEPRSPSIFLLDILKHVPPHLDQTAPSLLEKRNHLVELGIARKLERRVAGLCGGRARPIGDRWSSLQKLLLQPGVFLLQAGDLHLECRALIGDQLAGPAGITPA